MQDVNNWIAFGTVLGAVATCVAVLVAWNQLSELVKTSREATEASKSAAEANKLSILASVIELENSIDLRRFRLKQALDDLTAEGELEKQGIANRMEYKRDLLDEAIESYLNGVDRLCASILRNLITEDDYRADYRPLITDIMTDKLYQPFLTQGTIYRNIVKIHGKWADN